VAARTRHLIQAAVAGVLVAVVTLFGGLWLARAFDDTPAPDGEFLLDEPGVFAQPFDDVNDDSTGDRLPDIALLDQNGASVSLTDYVGQPLVVNFWFSNCPPCRRELADFAAVHAEVGDTVRFVGVDPFDTAESMVQFADERGVGYDLLLDDGTVSNELGIVGYPVTLFVDADGRILRQTGELDAEQLRSLIEALF